MTFPVVTPCHRLDEFDRMRQHYVAFSRPQGLLVLTASKTPASRFAAMWDGPPCWSSMDAPTLGRLFRQRFAPEGPASMSPTAEAIVFHRVKRLVTGTPAINIQRVRAS